MHLVLPEFCRQAEVDASLTWIVFGMFGGAPNGEWAIVKKALSCGDRVQCVSIDGLPNSIDVEINASPSFNLIECDVREPGSVKAAVDNCIERFESIDVLVYWIDGGFNKSEFEQWILGPVPISLLLEDEEETRRLIELNLLGLFHILQAVVPIMRNSSTTVSSSTQKRILYMSTILSVTGGPGMGPYSCSRRAGEGLLSSLACEALNEVFITVVDVGFTPVKQQRMTNLAGLLGELAHCGNPPCRISFGKQPSEATNNELRHTLEEIEDWKYLFEE